MDSVAASIVLLCAALLPVAAVAQTGSTLDRVRSRGALLCGIDRSEAEYSSSDEHGNRAAFDRDLCTAVAVAALGRGARMIVTYYADDVTSMQALADGRADVVASLSLREKPESAGGKPLPIGFTLPVFYDAVGLMVLRESGIQTAAQLSGRKICYLTETATETKLQQWFARHHLDLLPFPFQEEGEMEAAYVTDNCVGLAGDLTRLAQTRASTGTRADEYSILPQTFGADTLAMAYRNGDDAWATQLRAVRTVLIAAEEHALTQAEARRMVSSGEPEPSWLAAARGPVAPQNALAVIEAAGHYGELFDRDLGGGSMLRLDRGESALVRNGGMLGQ